MGRIVLKKRLLDSNVDACTTRDKWRARKASQEVVKNELCWPFLSELSFGNKLRLINLKKKDFDFDTVNKKSQKKLAAELQVFLGFDFVSIFKFNHFDKFSYLKEIKIFVLFLKCLCYEYPFDYILVDRVIDYWNKKSISIRRMPTIRKKLGGIKYIQIATLVTFYFHHKLDKNEKRILKLIDRIVDNGFEIYAIKFRKKWDFTEIFTDPENKGYLDKFFIDDDREFIKSLNMQYLTTYQEATNKWRDIFAQTVFSNNPDKGREIFDTYYNVLSKFMDWLVDSQKSMNKDMCDMKFTVSSNNEAPILVEYLRFIYQRNGGVQIKEIIDAVTWRIFVFNRMRGEFGYKNFWGKAKK